MAPTWSFEKSCFGSDASLRHNLTLASAPASGFICDSAAALEQNQFYFDARKKSQFLSQRTPRNTNVVQMNSSAQWYKLLQLSRCVPLKRSRPPHSNTTTSCYALVIRHADFTNIVFFHSPIQDEDIVIVAELVESENPAQYSGGWYTLAWTISPLYSIGKPISDFSTADYQMHISRNAIFLLQFKETRSSALLHCCKSYPQLVDANLEPTSPCVLNMLSVSFGAHAEKLEQAFIELLNNERLYRANRSPNEKDIQPMEVLERRLRIGIHNGFTYIEEPQCLHLCCAEEHIIDSESLRRKLRLVSWHNRTDLRSEDSTLFARNSVSLNKLVADPHFAIIFVLDYLVGVRACDGTISSSQSVMLAWGAWCPFTNEDTCERIKLPLTGGPRMNPDEMLCFKNALRWHGDYSANSTFGQLMPRVHICFSCSRIGKQNVSIELNDRLNTNEVVLQFIALADSRNGAAYSNLPESVFFTLNFYRFQQVTTERLLVYRGDRNFTHYEPCILKRVDNNGQLIEQQGNGFTVKYTVDRNSIPDGEEDDFILYLLSSNLIIDVWDADSLMPIGSAYLPLKCLLRQGCEAVQANVQISIVQNALPGRPEINSVLLMRVANIGHPSTRHIDLTHSRTSAIVSRRLNRLGQNDVESCRIRAKPLNPIHESALQRFMAAQKLDIKLRHEEIFSEDSLRRIQNFSKGQVGQTNAVAKGSVKRFMFHQELEAYKKLRSESKALKLLRAVFKAITTEHRIFPSLGEVQFFEFLLQNTQPESLNVILEITETTLSPILDVDAWEFFKRANSIYSAVERDLFNVTTSVDGSREVHICLKPMQAVFVPFKYDGFTLPRGRRTDQVKAVFKRWDTLEPIAIIDLIAENRPNTINQSFRFIHEAETKMSKIIRISETLDSRRVLSVRCTDPTVMVVIKNDSDGSQDLLLTCYSGSSKTTASLRSFVVFLYGDKYEYRLVAVWAIHVHSAVRIDACTVQAQLTKLPLILKTDGADHMVQLFSSSSQILLSPSQQFLTSNSPIYEISAHFTPTFTGDKTFLLTAVDVRTHQLLNQWIIFARVQSPNVVRSFRVRLHVASSEMRKITLNNEYNIERTYRVVSSRPELVRVDGEMVFLEAHTSTQISVTFLPVGRPLSVEVLLFVLNAENDLQEEAYSIMVDYYEE
ncbi:Nephrocystin-4 [Toxocara canis]|uniref:Nephrocystin-4 n=1 Tax=Toxocara canis TaxID=6265 RepID=A0A0B2V5Z7_TOXCA|nr:Nephrocystin-4 [Toxocara canis]